MSVMHLRFYGLTLVDVLPICFRHPIIDTHFQVEFLGPLSEKLGAARC